MKTKDELLAECFGMLRGYISPIQPEDSMTFEKAETLLNEIREHLSLSADCAAISAKLSERRTVHEWLNNSGVPQEEMGNRLCLLRRLRIAINKLDDRKQALESCSSFFAGPTSADRRGFDGICQAAIGWE